MKNCNIIMEKYLELDKGQHIPLLLTAHFLICKNCRSEVRSIQKAESAASSNMQVGIKDQTIAAVMQRIYASDKSQKNPVSLSKWIVGGMVIAAMFLAFTIFASRLESGILKIITYFEFSATITVYCVLFIKSNLDFFVKLINTKIPNFTFQEGQSD